jgi:hypothetical protein
MSAVLRGRSFPFEHCFGVLTEAMKNQLPPHVDRMPSGPAHDVDTHIWNTEIGAALNEPYSRLFRPPGQLAEKAARNHRPCSALCHVSDKRGTRED